MDILVDATRKTFEPVGEAVVSEPYAGAYVPARWYGLDRRATAIMLEIRRGPYLDEITGDPTAGINEVSAATASFLSRAIDSERLHRAR